MSTAPQMLNISWDEFHRETLILAARLQSLRSWEGIIAVTRGGMVPAAILARELGIRRVDTICISSYNECDQGELTLLKNTSCSGQGWLVVDDLVDSGATAKFVKNLLPDIFLATVYAKPAGQPLADAYVRDVAQETWINFPWDLHLVHTEPLHRKP
ncbi:MAG: xanthine phosphoribosyltransferase [Opitutales bacterium]|nr:xanthine phosphoribosyltransferase [Opitutales bacterium]